jgi:hypothetical protein
MFNPNKLDQLRAAVQDDLQFLGFTVTKEGIFLEVGNESVTLSRVKFCVQDGEALAKIYTVSSKTERGVQGMRVKYDGEMESFSEAVCVKVVKQCLRRRAQLGI